MRPFLMINFLGTGWLLRLAALKDALFLPAVLPAIGLELAGEHEVINEKAKTINAINKAGLKADFIKDNILSGKISIFK